MSGLAKVGNDVTDMHPRIPESIRPLLREYLQLMEKELPGFLIGFYLHGSLALEAFNDGWSDIDFIAVINRKCVTEDIGHLKSIHARVSKKYPRWDLSGCYLQLNDLGQPDESVAPVPCHHEGVLSSGGHPDTGLVTWWLLKNRGIALIGDEPGDLPFTVDWETLIAGMRQNLNTYWKDFTCKPKRMAWLLTDYGVQWAVLGVLRLYYTFREQDIASKIGAGEYALRHLPNQWHPIIREAINIRDQKKGAFYKFKFTRGAEAIKFVKFVIEECNRNI